MFMSSLFHRTDLNVGITEPIAGVRSGTTSQQSQIHDFTKRFYVPSKTKHPLQWYVLVDTMALVIGLFSAWGLAALINSVFFGRVVIDPFSEDGLVRVMEFVLIATIVLIWFQHTDHYRICMPFWIEIRKIVSTLAFAAMADGFLQFASKHDLSRLWLMSGWVIAAIAMIVL